LGAIHLPYNAKYLRRQLEKDGQQFVQGFKTPAIEGLQVKVSGVVGKNKVNANDVGVLQLVKPARVGPGAFAKGHGKHQVLAAGRWQMIDARAHYGLCHYGIYMALPGGWQGFLGSGSYAKQNPKP
jgi:hypothetical protein